MSRENVELARKACAAFNRRDADALAESCDPELEFVSLVAESEGQVSEATKESGRFSAGRTKRSIGSTLRLRRSPSPAIS
jgi:hypothetical protein